MRKKDILGSFVRNPDVLYDYEVKKLDDGEAYTALITFLPGSRELIVEYDGEKVCLASPGYKLLMYLPLNEYWCLATAFNLKNEVHEWYFDISRSNFIDEDGMPCIDDIYLDLAVMHDGKIVTLDADELQEALDNGEITIEDFNHAYTVHDEIKNSKWSDVDFLKNLTDKLLSDYI